MVEWVMEGSLPLSRLTKRFFPFRIRARARDPVRALVVSVFFVSLYTVGLLFFFFFGWDPSRSRLDPNQRRRERERDNETNQGHVS